MSRSPTPQKSPALPASIDRQTTTPFLLNFCYRSSAFHNLTDFPLPTPHNPQPHLPAHLQIYTWMSCTLKELAHLLTSALPSILPSPAVGTRLAFRLVYPDPSAGRRGMEGRLGDEGKGRYMSREMGSVVIGETRDQNGGDVGGKDWELAGEDAGKSLEDVRFVIGDFVDCAVFAPLSDGSVVSRSSVMGPGPRRDTNGFGRGYGRGRGGGFGRGGGEGVPSGEWRRGERLPDRGGYSRGGGGGGGDRGYGGGRGRY